ncbi:MAG: hypothetical protein JWR07_3177 [Nevskia sp.]|nr:hypothetical protein [Nevskia sp.]
MQKTTLHGVTISQVQRTHAWWLYLWPFQSRRILWQSIILMGTCLPIMGVTVYLLDPAGLWPVLLGGTTGYFLCVLYPLLAARLTLATRSEARHCVADLQARLLKFGYVAKELEAPLVPGRFVYQSKHEFWRRDEQNVELLVREHNLVLNGPVAILRLLRTKLLLPDDYAYLKA